MAEKTELEQTHCVVSKVFAFTVPPLGSADGFKASLWPKQPIWVGRLRVVSRGGKCAVLLEHTDRDGLFASCPIQNEKTVEPAIDSSRYFVLRLSDGKGRHALIGIGFNDRAQAFDFKVSLQDWENSNREGVAPVSTGPSQDFSIPAGGSIHVAFGSSAAKKQRKSSVNAGQPDVSAALSGLKLDAPPKEQKEEKEKKKKKKKDKATDEFDHSFAPSAAASSVVGASSSSSSSSAAAFSSPQQQQPATADLFGFGDFDPLSTPKQQQAAPPRRASIQDPFASSAAPSFGASSNATPFDTPFDDTPADWVKF